MSAVDHPAHYNSHPSGMECIQLVERLPFCSGNAIKYLWRAGLKGPALEDLRKARWYVERQMNSEDALQNGDTIMNDHKAIRRACLGLSALVGSAISHIVQDEFELALHCIDALIDQQEAAK